MGGSKSLEGLKPVFPPGRQQRENTTRDYPLVCISAAERADRTARNLCWYCPEKYSREHVCAKKFYVLMGEDSEDEEESSSANRDRQEEDGVNMAITGDVSRIFVIGPKIKPRSIRLPGYIRDSLLSVLIDGGSTHNFVKPSVAEKLCLPLQVISPFRVFVGNGASMRCDYVSLHTPLTLQGHPFDIDLFLSQVEGPDVVLGVQWLQDLGDVTKNYRTLQMKFILDSGPVCLQGEDASPRQISYNGLFSLMGQEPDSQLFKLVNLDHAQLTDKATVLPENPLLTDTLAAFDRVFEVPNRLPPSRKCRLMSNRTVIHISRRRRLRNKSATCSNKA